MQAELTRTTGTQSRRHLAMLAATSAAITVLAVPVTAQAPDEIHLTGIVRDFTSAHVDFDLTPPDGLGHYVANVDVNLGMQDRPVFVGGGYKVVQEWLDSDERSIAPHMFGIGGGDSRGLNVIATEQIQARNQSNFDSYDSSLGPYGGTNVGTEVLMATNSTLPGMVLITQNSTVFGDVLIGPGGDPAVVVDADQGLITGTVGELGETVTVEPIVVPGDMPPYSATDIDVAVGATVTISGDHHVDLFNIRRNAVVTIQGDVRVHCEDRFLIGKNARVLIPDGSSLSVWCETQCRLYGPDTILNPDTANPDKVRLYMMGSDPWNDQLVANGSETYITARVYAPDNILDLDQSTEFFGTFMGKGIALNNTSNLHVDVRNYDGYANCLTVEDTEGLGGIASDGGISGSASFDEWYNDVLGVNLSLPHAITLVRNGDGVYEYLNSGFHPIDGQLFGNEGDIHNRFYTYAIEAEFTFNACTGQFVSFQGGDGMWLFIDGQMVIDL
ncbi:MAG: DUF7305 domain-containing protein, partial [Planctomycetota bacterium]